MKRYSMFLIITLLAISYIPVKASEISLSWDDIIYSSINLYPGDVYDITDTFTIIPDTEDTYYEITYIDNPYSMLISDDGVITALGGKEDSDITMFIKPLNDKTQAIQLNIHIYKTGTSKEINTDNDNNVNTIINSEYSNSEINQKLEELSRQIEEKIEEQNNKSYWKNVYLTAVSNSLNSSTDEDDYEGYKIEIIENKPQPTSIKTKPANITKAKILSLKNKKKNSIQIKFKSLDNAVSYQIDLSTSKSFNKFTRYNSTNTNCIIKKLKKNKTYYVRIRGINGNTKGSFSSIKKIKITKWLYKGRLY